jgi:septal ring factor EnvC (AmiA/AmiB activator)
MYLQSPSFADASNATGIVTVKKLTMRAAPQLNAPILITLTKGKKIQIYEDQNGWIKIAYEGQVGFIRKLRKKAYELLVKREEPIDKKDHKRNITKLKKEAEALNNKIKKQKAQIRSINKTERTILTNLNATDLSLNKSKKLASLIRTDLSVLSKKITETKNATKTLEAKIKSNEKYTAKRLIALYKLNWLGKMHMIASAESMDELLQRKVYLERILSHDRQTINHLIENKNQHTTLLKTLKTQQNRKLSLENDYKDQISITSNRKKEKQKLLKDIRNKKSLQLASIKALQKASTELDQTIKALTLEISRSGKPANSSQKSFSALKGLLKMPVKGKIGSKFGPYRNKKLNVMNYRNGINIIADKGEPIKAVMAGNVLFASWFKGYGNMIILDHGNRYYTLYANAEELFKQKGETVKTNEIIGIVGDTGSLIGPKLYFEIRHKDKPVDPLKWLRTK